MAKPGKQGKSFVSRPLLTWYDTHARILPWRVGPAARKAGHRPDPYHVWLSEIMLQQTTVATVTPRFETFLERWPTVAALAASPQEDVLHEWAGLGYYARARNLHKCARMIVADYNSTFPETAIELQKLPGIGPYTAAAIAAIAFDEPAVVMDGNIERVMARLFAEKEPLPGVKPVLYEYAASQTPKKRPGDHAQALMDLGATICTPRNPACGICPLQKKCLGFAKNIAAELPVKARKQPKPVRRGVVYFIRRPDGALLLIRRPEKGLLGGMRALPSSEWTETAPKSVAPVTASWTVLKEPVRHTFTHFHLLLEVQMAQITGTAAKKLAGEWHEAPLDAGLPTVFKKAVKAALAQA